MNVNVFLFVKFFIETMGMALCLALGISRGAGDAAAAGRASGAAAVFRSASAVLKRTWSVYPISAFLQVLVYTHVRIVGFTIQYVLWNLAVLWLIWKIAIRKMPRLAGVLISYLLVAFQFCQLFATFFVYSLPGFSSSVASFSMKETLVSTAVIWSCGLMSAAFSIPQIPAVDDLAEKETFWNNLFIWLFYVTEVSIRYLLVREQEQTPLTVAALMLLFATLNLFFAVSMLSVRERCARIEEMQMRQASELQVRHYEEIGRLYRKFREVRHDMRNQAVYVRQMLDEGKYDLLRDYYDTIWNDSLPGNQLADCGNQLVNAVLWSKREAAEKAGIPMEIDAALPPQLPFKGYQLCALIGNLLDNAIEAEKETAEPAISATMTVKQGYLFIRVANRVDRDVLAENPTLATTKADAADHGYGILNVRRIAEEYEGMCDFSVKEGWFTAAVMLRMR